MTTVMEARRQAGIDPELRTKATVEEGIVHQSGAVEDQACFVEYQPGNGTRYAIVLTRLDYFDEGALTRLGLSGSTSKQRWLVTLPTNRGDSMVFGNSDFLHYNYVREKTGMGLVDAAVLAELLAHLCGLKCVPLDQVSLGD